MQLVRSWVYSDSKKRGLKRDIVAISGTKDKNELPAKFSKSGVRCN